MHGATAVVFNTTGLLSKQALYIRSLFDDIAAYKASVVPEVVPAFNIPDPMQFSNGTTKEALRDMSDTVDKARALDACVLSYKKSA